MAAVIQLKQYSNDSPLLTADVLSQAGGCFLEEKLKPRKKTATSLAVLKDNSKTFAECSILF
jgi:hypothetical protein